jgi:NADP-dependent 3-hydroxy acid dehydrogenase YdfG
VLSGRCLNETEQSADCYAATFDTNVLGTLLSLKHELRLMTAQKSGSMVNISSVYVGSQARRRRHS